MEDESLTTINEMGSATSAALARNRIVFNFVWTDRCFLKFNALPIHVDKTGYRLPCGESAPEHRIRIAAEIEREAETARTVWLHCSCLNAGSNKVRFQ